MRRGLFVRASVSLALASAVGCTQGNAAEQDTATRQSVAAQGRELTDSERILVDQARELLVKDCMEAEGFRYWPGPVAGIEDRQGSGYVLDDVGWARKHGYGTRLQKKVEAALQSDPDHAYANALPEAERVRYSKTLDGNPVDGMLTAELPTGGSIQTPRHSCQTEAKEELYGDFPAWFRAEKAVTNLAGLYVPDLKKDERFTTALKAWSACMRERGHDYPDPARIREQLPHLTKGLSDTEAHAAEVNLAVDEAECATKETSLVRTARALEREYRGRLREYRDDIANHQHMQLRALERAKNLYTKATCAPDN